MLRCLRNATLGCDKEQQRHCGEDSEDSEDSETGIARRRNVPALTGAQTVRQPCPPVSTNRRYARRGNVPAGATLWFDEWTPPSPPEARVARNIPLSSADFRRHLGNLGRGPSESPEGPGGRTRSILNAPSAGGWAKEMPTRRWTVHDKNKKRRENDSRPWAPRTVPHRTAAPRTAAQLF